jgi:hypothetical protein
MRERGVLLGYDILASLSNIRLQNVRAVRCDERLSYVRQEELPGESPHLPQELKVYPTDASAPGMVLVTPSPPLFHFCDVGGSIWFNWLMAVEKALLIADWIVPWLKPKMHPTRRATRNGNRQPVVSL